MSFGFGQLIVVLLLVLVLFGAGKLPKVMSDLGKGLKSFKSAMNEEEKKDDSSGEDKK